MLILKQITHPAFVGKSLFDNINPNRKDTSLMAKSSKLTAGDGLSMAAEVLKLLTPVLKNAKREQVENLKKHSRDVQRVVQWLLSGDLIDGNMESPMSTRMRLENETGLLLKPGVYFSIMATSVKGEEGEFLFKVTLFACDGTGETLWELEFEQLLDPPQGAKIFIPLWRVYEKDSLENVHERLMAKRGNLVIHREKNVVWQYEVEFVYEGYCQTVILSKGQAEAIFLSLDEE